jgi:hypothetical protein
MTVLLLMDHQDAICIEFADANAGNAQQTYAQCLGVPS